MSKNILIDGECGKLEININLPKVSEEEITGYSIICHPHPLFGGTMENKVVKTIENSLINKKYIVFKFNFRGVGKSNGKFSNGIGETNDLYSIIKYSKKFIENKFSSNKKIKSNLILSGFSFGAFTISEILIKKIDFISKILKLIIYVGPPIINWNITTLPKKTIVIHGEKDEIIPINNIYKWAKEQKIFVLVIPDSTHFFHKRLNFLEKSILFFLN